MKQGILDTRCHQDSNHLASFRMKMDTFMIADFMLESESWIQNRILEFMRENVSKGVDPVLVV